jgi:hypothetical protein
MPCRDAARKVSLKQHRLLLQPARPRPLKASISGPHWGLCADQDLCMTAGTLITCVRTFCMTAFNRHMPFPSNFDYLPLGVLVWLVENHVLSKRKARVHLNGMPNTNILIVSHCSCVHSYPKGNMPLLLVMHTATAVHGAIVQESTLNLQPCRTYPACLLSRPSKHARMHRDTAPAVCLSHHQQYAGCIRHALVVSLQPVDGPSHVNQAQRAPS